MSRKSAMIEEEFDDDTDLPLPSQPLPNTGSRGPLLQHIDEFEQEAGPASPPSSRTTFATSAPSDEGSQPRSTITDITPYKSWSCIYPIYIDAKRPYTTGERRVPRNQSVWWPLSKDIADACHRLGLGTLHEVNKSHPRDWENPGRVRVQWKRNGNLVNPQIKTKKELLRAITFQIHLLKPENVPKPPYSTSSTVDTNQEQKPPPSSTLQAKGKLPQSALKSSPPTNPSPQLNKRKLPQPPEPHPPLNSRVSTYSPAIATGVLIETVKAGLNATEGGAQAGGAQGQGGPQGLPGKGKRKVIRVRG